jgi:cation transport regulator ChaC
MITVTDGPIITVTGKESTTYDAVEVPFKCEVDSATGAVTATLFFVDADGRVLVEVPWLEYVQADFVIASESITNPNVVLLRELEKLLKTYLETQNPGATFTIV